MFDIKGKTAIVTGGASGIGLATVEGLLRKGANVVMADINEYNMHIESTRLTLEYPMMITTKKADVSDPEQVKELVDFAVETFGSVDIMIANAGVDIAKPHTSEHLAEAKKTIDINLLGAYYCDLFAIEQMVKQGTGGAVVNTASVASYRGIMGHVLYSASKHGLIGLTKALSNEYAYQDIRVNAVSPGGVETPMGISEYPEEMKVQLREATKHTQPRGFALPEDIAHSIIFAVENTQLTGSNIIVDGGLGSMFRTMGQ